MPVSVAMRERWAWERVVSDMWFGTRFLRRGAAPWQGEDGVFGKRFSRTLFPFEFATNFQLGDGKQILGASHGFFRGDQSLAGEDADGEVSEADFHALGEAACVVAEAFDFTQAVEDTCISIEVDVFPATSLCFFLAKGLRRFLVTNGWCKRRERFGQSRKMCNYDVAVHSSDRASMDVGSHASNKNVVYLECLKMF